jgi:thiosulfate/3-mercaptopyruvate sulfurtransferase
MLVTQAWLTAHLADPNVVVIHVANTRRDYLNGHVPGARFMWTGAFAPSTPDLSTELPPVAQVDSALESIGVGDRTRIVIYGANMPMTARLYLTLEWLGAGDRTSILDGGLAGWKAAGQSVATDVPSAAARARFTPHVRPVTVEAALVRESIGRPGVRILDARDRQFYDGAAGGMPRPGHVPSALSIPFSSLLTETGAFKSRDALREMFSAAGVQPGEKIVTYCHVGQQASLLWFTARMLGYDAKLYDGSFEDWSGRADYPLEGPVKR